MLCDLAVEHSLYVSGYKSILLPTILKPTPVNIKCEVINVPTRIYRNTPVQIRVKQGMSQCSLIDVWKLLFTLIFPRDSCNVTYKS